MNNFLTSGRRSRFKPEREAHRPRAEVNLENTGSTRLTPETERELAIYAKSLIENNLFQGVLQDLADAARDRYENSLVGVQGQADRETGHGMLVALRAIDEKLRAMAEDADLHDRIEREAAEADNA